MSARDSFLDYVVNEIWGPVLPVPEDSIPIDKKNDKGQFVVTTEEQYPRFHDPESMQSILISSSPETTYGTGILHAPDSGAEHYRTEPEEDFNLPEPGDVQEGKPPKTITNYKEESDEDRAVRSV